MDEHAAAGEALGPPDTRGPSAPLPRGVFLLGAAALIGVLAGSLVLQFVFSSRGGGVTESCVELGVRAVLSNGDPAVGASGVCHIVEALRSSEETILLNASVIVAVLAIAAGLWFYRRMPTRRMRNQCIAGAVLGTQAVALAVGILFFRRGEVGIFARNFLNLDLLRGTLDDFVGGARITLQLAFAGELGGVVIGVILAMLAISDHPVVRAPARIYINFFRGTPLIWQLSIAYFGVSLGLGLKLSALTLATGVFAVNTGAYAAEVFRAGIQSIERGQMEAARSLGFSYLQSMRYAIVPQAVRRVIPPLMNEFVILIKDTSLIFVLGILATQRDLYAVGREIYSSSFNATPFIATAAGYLIITLPLIWVVNRVEKRLHSGLVGITGAGH